MMSLNFPPYLKPGDSVTAIAPSGALKDIKALEAGFKIIATQHPVIEDNIQTQALGIGNEYHQYNPFFIIEAMKS